MIKNKRHTGLVVRNLENSLKFYEGLGFKVWKREIETGDFIDSVVGIPNVRIETAKLKAQDNSLLELIQYHSHPQTRGITNSSSNQLGCSHVAYTVENIDEACSLIKTLGGSIVNKPAVSPAGNVKVAYCHDNEGILIEIVEELDHG
jgi:catechol 2,3-dioxygenase-like lactoylglutathione lyase family enzyme